MLSLEERAFVHSPQLQRVAQNKLQTSDIQRLLFLLGIVCLKKTLNPSQKNK
jgi:hypothetical protein